MTRLERELRSVLRATDWDVKATAERLGVSRQTIYNRMERFGVESPLSAAEKAARSGAIGGSRRAENQTADERRDLASRAAQARWSRERGAA
jgi:hypothetical protein